MTSKDPLASLDMDKLAGKLQDRLEHVKLGDVTDAAFKAGVWASCVIGSKFLLDMVPIEDMFKWARENKDMTNTALQSFLIGQVSAPLAVVPIIKQLLGNEEFKEDIRNVGVEAGLIYVYSQTLNPVALIEAIIHAPDAVQAVLKNKEAQVATVASSRAHWESEVTARQNRLEAYRLQIAEFGHGALSADEHLDFASLQRGADDVGSIAYALKKLAEAEKAEKDAKDALAVFNEAVARTAKILRWSIALVVGTYLAGSMVYAGDTLLDSIQSTFNMFKIPFKGGV